MPHDPTNSTRRFHVSDRVFWAGVALVCASILSSSAGSQRPAPPTTSSRSTPNTRAAAKPPVTIPPAKTTATPAVLRTRLIEVTDVLGRPRIRMMVRADGEAVLEFVRPDSSTPTIALYDMLKGRPIPGSKTEPTETREGVTGIHINGPTREERYGLIQLERTGGSEAFIRLARGNSADIMHHATLEPDAVRFLKSGSQAKARVYGVEP